MQIQLPRQTATRPLRIFTMEESIILSAAKERAQFWKYPEGQAWTVPVLTPNGEVQVHSTEDGKMTIKFPKSKQ